VDGRRWLNPVRIVLATLAKHNFKSKVMTMLTAALALGSGVSIGFILGLIGGGGSILALPLLVYVVAVPSVHVAIGTSALAVAINALAGVAAHARQGTIKWACASVFAGAGAAGALAGAHMGKSFDGEKLLALFGLLMIAIGANMLRGQSGVPDANVRLTFRTAPRMLPWLIGVGLAVGLLSGFFGIGGGFLIVPGLMLATGMPLNYAVGTSLVAVSALGFTTAGSYAWSGLIDWPLAGLVIAGGVAGAFAGSKAGALIGKSKKALTLIFAAVVIGVGAFIVAKGAGTLLATFGL